MRIFVYPVHSSILPLQFWNASGNFDELNNYNLQYGNTGSNNSSIFPFTKLTNFYTNEIYYMTVNHFQCIKKASIEAYKYIKNNVEVSSIRIYRRVRITLQQKSYAYISGEQLNLLNPLSNMYPMILDEVDNSAQTSCPYRYFIIPNNKFNIDDKLPKDLVREFDDLLLGSGTIAIFIHGGIWYIYEGLGYYSPIRLFENLSQKGIFAYSGLKQSIHYIYVTSIEKNSKIVEGNDKDIEVILQEFIFRRSLISIEEKLEDEKLEMKARQRVILRTKIEEDLKRQRLLSYKKLSDLECNSCIDIFQCPQCNKEIFPSENEVEFHTAVILAKKGIWYEDIIKPSVSLNIKSPFYTLERKKFEELCFVRVEEDSKKILQYNLISQKVSNTDDVDISEVSPVSQSIGYEELLPIEVSEQLPQALDHSFGNTSRETPVTLLEDSPIFQELSVKPLYKDPLVLGVHSVEEFKSDSLDKIKLIDESESKVPPELVELRKHPLYNTSLKPKELLNSSAIKDLPASIESSDKLLHSKSGFTKPSVKLFVRNFLKHREPSSFLDQNIKKSHESPLGYTISTIPSNKIFNTESPSLYLKDLDNSMISREISVIQPNPCIKYCPKFILDTVDKSTETASIRAIEKFTKYLSPLFNLLYFGNNKYEYRRIYDSMLFWGFQSGSNHLTRLSNILYKKSLDLNGYKQNQPVLQSRIDQKASHILATNSVHRDNTITKPLYFNSSTAYNRHNSNELLRIKRNSITKPRSIRPLRKKIKRRYPKKTVTSKLKSVKKSYEDSLIPHTRKRREQKMKRQI
ncbi:uncharacterized protein CMU_018670 [Cryptosporidium muris RN66]|uniref:Uncharacterized protein n=1 Tax=Cryptosporidium muris (strain RN66) TaxID=441375 RepID=B6ADA6_CRYMR|nr:uncharacterized protein CMU_018670 [Cryptosporidium muris RN66]EEA06110.1 hypothetical protein, conserved [Cryptosporidium muris RN66]|eukprot:XP_002140459.1 hypothetical protein [Cryptosporidium muris RN66]